MGALFRNLASMAQKLSSALGATVENQPLNKAGNKKCNGESKKYLDLGSNKGYNCRKGEQAEDEQNFLAYTIIHISPAPPCYNFSCRGGG